MFWALITPPNLASCLSPSKKQTYKKTHMKNDMPKRLQHEYDIRDAKKESHNEPNLQFEPLFSKIGRSLRLFNFIRNLAKQGQVN